MKITAKRCILSLFLLMYSVPVNAFWGLTGAPTPPEISQYYSEIENEPYDEDEQSNEEDELQEAGSNFGWYMNAAAASVPVVLAMTVGVKEALIAAGTVYGVTRLLTNPHKKLIPFDGTLTEAMKKEIMRARYSNINEFHAWDPTHVSLLKTYGIQGFPYIHPDKLVQQIQSSHPNFDVFDVNTYDLDDLNVHREAHRRVQEKLERDRLEGEAQTAFFSLARNKKEKEVEKIPLERGVPTKENLEAYEEAKKKAYKNVNQMNQDVKKGRVKGIVRVDQGHNIQSGGKPHVHFDDDTSLNWDGTIHDQLKGVPRPTKEQKAWLSSWGWANTAKRMLYPAFGWTYCRENECSYRRPESL